MRAAFRSGQKYHNKKTAGFDSKKEFNRWAELKLMERAGQISGLQRQVKYELIPAQYKDGKCIFRAASYVADFVYVKNGETFVEDCKGFRTDVYRLKAKMMYQKYGVLIKET